ncbi:MAG: alpha/beta hydrolase-fold protein [Candidatus Nanopelagicales bacterium]|nr:alpha/beta hydrolase-fold protein [Candidatus Nanopelagicales bacterium]
MISGTGAAVGPVVTDGEVAFTIDADLPWVPRRLWFHLRDFGADTRFHRTDRGWVCRIPRPPVDRMEYLISGVDPDGTEFMCRDPHNPDYARGVFGDHSVVRFPQYRPPAWLGHEVPLGSTEPILVTDEAAQIVLTGDLWVPSESLAADRLPLLLVHDGPEYVDLAELLAYLGHVWDQDPDLRCRVLLLKPVDRDRSYSASPGYARALMQQALPQIRAAFNTADALVGMGASLGALSMLHAAVSQPGEFAGLFLQSGSFFSPRFDEHERGFGHYDRVVRFVADACADPARLAGTTVALTCGSGEENLDNNRLFVSRLQSGGIPASLTENRDGHNYTAWRDSLDAGLSGVLQTAWASEAGA